VLDEIFAVGDVGFRAKCEERYRQLRAAGHTAIIVSQAPDDVRGFCDRGILIGDGRVTCTGAADLVADAYLDLMSAGTTETVPQHQ